MWVKDSDLWETCLLVALLGCLWLIVWRRMSIRSSQRRQRRDQPPPGNGGEVRAQTLAHPSNPSTAQQPAPADQTPSSPDDGAATQQSQGNQAAPHGLANGPKLPQTVPVVCELEAWGKILDGLGHKRKWEAVKSSAIAEIGNGQHLLKPQQSCCLDRVTRQNSLLLCSCC